MAVKRAYSYEDINRIIFKTIEINEEWKPHLGEPQLGNSHWLIFGDSGHGKTSYVLQIVKMLCQNCQRVHYNTAEEGLKKSFKMALFRSTDELRMSIAPYKGYTCSKITLLMGLRLSFCLLRINSQATSLNFHSTAGCKEVNFCLISFSISWLKLSMW